MDPRTGQIIEVENDEGHQVSDEQKGNSRG